MTTFLPNPLSSIFRLERDVKRDQGSVNATDSLHTPSCVLLSLHFRFLVPGTGKSNNWFWNDTLITNHNNILGDLVVLAGVDLVWVEVKRTTNLVGERGNGDGRAVFLWEKVGLGRSIVFGSLVCSATLRTRHNSEKLRTLFFCLLGFRRGNMR